MKMSHNNRYGEQDILIALGVLQSPGNIVKCIGGLTQCSYTFYDVNVLYCPSVFLY